MKQYIILIIFSLLNATFSYSQTGNLITGNNSGTNITSADYITIFGDNSGNMMTDRGNHSTLFGYQVSDSLNEHYNTFFGYQAGFSSNSGYNLMLGAEAGLNSKGEKNIYIGYRAGRLNADGKNNTFIGYKAGEESTKGDDNIFIGGSAGDESEGSDNIFIGHNTGWVTSASTGSRNVGIGTNLSNSNNYLTYGATIAGYGSDLFYRLTTGEDNLVVGMSSGGRIRDGSRNTIIGNYIAIWLDNGSQDNTFIGFGSANEIKSTALFKRNTFVGYGTSAGEYYYLLNEDNSILGHASEIKDNSNRTIIVGVSSEIDADDAISIGNLIDNFGDKSIIVGENGTVTANSTGAIGMGYQTNLNNSNYSIGIGSQADIDNQYTVGIGTNVNIDNENGIAIGDNAAVTGNNSIALGNAATVSGANSIALGNGVNVSTDNTVTVGNASVTSIRGSVNWTALSDGRFKKNIQENVSGLNFINDLRPVSYKLKSQNNNRYNGFIAQEVEAAAKANNFNFSGVKTPQNDNDIYGLRYAEFVVPLTKAVQELDVELQASEAMIAKNEATIAKYADTVAELRAKVEALKIKKSMTKEPIVAAKK